MGIRFFRKSVFDADNTLASVDMTDSVAANDGSAFTDLMRNRDNLSGWGTTDSSDAGLTTMVIDLGDTRDMDAIILAEHNLKSFTLKNGDGTTWNNFSTTIAPTDNTESTTYHSFDSTTATHLQLIMNSTQVVDADKFIRQFIVTEQIGELTIQPEIQPEWDKSRKVTKYLSGKSHITKSVGAFRCRIRMGVVSNDADLTLIETLFNAYDGFLVWPCGGDVAQFETIREGYRLQDIFLMDLINDYAPQFNDSRWNHGIPIDLRLVEIN